METGECLPPPPELTSEAIADLIRMEMLSYERPGLYIGRLSFDYATVRVRRGMLAVMGKHLELADKDKNGGDERRDARLAFEQGGVLAIRAIMAQKRIGEFKASSKLPHILSDTSFAEDAAEQRRITEEAILGYGLAGYASVDEAYRLLVEELLQGRMVGLDYQDHFRAGFGLLLRHAEECEMWLQLEENKKELDELDPNWFNEFEALVFGTFDDNTALGDEGSKATDGSQNRGDDDPDNTIS